MSADIRDELVMALKDQILKKEGGNVEDDTWWAIDHASDYADIVLARFDVTPKDPA